jgi:hypothetical protein
LLFCNIFYQKSVIKKSYSVFLLLFCNIFFVKNNSTFFWQNFCKTTTKKKVPFFDQKCCKVTRSSKKCQVYWSQFFWTHLPPTFFKWHHCFVQKDVQGIVFQGFSRVNVLKNRYQHQRCFFSQLLLVTCTKISFPFRCSDFKTGRTKLTQTLHGTLRKLMFNISELFFVIFFFQGAASSGMNSFTYASLCAEKNSCSQDQIW